MRIHRLLARVAAGLATWLAVIPAAGQSATNLGFEEVRDSAGVLRPAGWVSGGAGYEVVIDTTQHVEGHASLRSHLAGAMRPERAFGVGTQRLPVAQAAGRTLRLTGWIRTQDVGEGYAGLWMRVDGPDRTTLAFDNMTGRGPTGTTPWTRYTVELPVDSSAVAVYVGVLHPGTGTAWFDSLAVEVVGPPLPRRPAAYRPPPRPAEDFTRLLSDRELALPPDTAEPAENPAWREWVRTHAHPVRSLGAADASDLRFLVPLLRGKRIVQLGESGHGVAEFDRAKVRLIRYLHEALGYDVIAFESGLFECDRAGRSAARLEAAQLMRACIFPVWHTEEVLPLFEYIRQTQRTEHPLILTGFDVQHSSASVSARPAFLARVVAAAGDSAYARRVRETDSVFIATLRTADEAARRVSVAREERRLVSFYDSLAVWLRARETSLAPAFRDDPAAPALARQVAVYTPVFIRELVSSGPPRTEIRDRGMADNLDFVLDQLHPGKKVIVWAHNYHVRHRGYGQGAQGQPPRTMGTYVAERHRTELYTIGLYMYRGSNAANTRVPIRVTPAEPGSLESVLHGAPWSYSFVDLSRAEPGPGTGWIFGETTAKDWGINPETMIPRPEYDGILFIDTTWPPSYLPREP